jgi:hypothetical protein
MVVGGGVFGEDGLGLPLGRYTKKKERDIRSLSTILKGVKAYFFFR